MFRVKLFNGKKQNSPVCWSQFGTLCATKGCAEALSMLIMGELQASDADAIDIQTTPGKASKEAKAQNSLAMSYLILAMDSPKLLKMVEASKSTTWPAGLACEFVKRLNKKYQPDDTLAIAEMATKLSKLKLKKEDHPEDLQDNTSAIEAQYGCNVDAQQMIATVVRAAGKHYSGVIYQVTERHEDAGTKVTPDDLSEAMGKAWRVSGGGDDSGDDSDDKVNETALGVTNTNNIKCNSCGEMGYYSSNCPKRGGNEMGKKYMGTCFLCGKQNHKKHECWELESNSSKGPNG